MSAAARAGVRAAMISTSRVGVASRAFVPVAAVRASSAAVVARPAAFVAQQGSASWGLRLKSTWASKPIITYEELKPITQQPNDEILVVDVREPDEVALGTIPSAVSLPLSQLRDALDKNYSPGEFQKKFAFPKPLPSQNIIFFCRSGKRSATASEWAAERGYENVRNYSGSWLDWEKRERADGNDD